MRGAGVPSPAPASGTRFCFPTTTPVTLYIILDWLRESLVDILAPVVGLQSINSNGQERFTARKR